MKDIKLGMIGTNFVSDWLADAAGCVDGITPCAIYSRTSESGGRFAEKHGIGRVYTDFEEFLSSGIDAVYIASPNILHKSQALAAMKHGLHVIVEKPAAICAKDYAEMTECAEKNGVVIMEAMRPMHDPVLDIVRSLISGIGIVRHASFEFCQYSSRYDRFKSGEILNAFNSALGNAALMDIGVYAVEVCVALMGVPDSVYAKSSKLGNDMEAGGCVLLGYGDATATVLYSKTADSLNPSVILGEGGAVSIGKLSTLECVSVRKRSGESSCVIENRRENNMIYELADFRDAVNGTKSTDLWNRTTLESLKIMDTIRDLNGIEFR